MEWRRGCGSNQVTPLSIIPLQPLLEGRQRCGERVCVVEWWVEVPPPSQCWIAHNGSFGAAVAQWLEHTIRGAAEARWLGNPIMGPQLSIFAPLMFVGSSAGGDVTPASLTGIFLRLLYMCWLLQRVGGDVMPASIAAVGHSLASQKGCNKATSVFVQGEGRAEEVLRLYFAGNKQPLGCLYTHANAMRRQIAGSWYLQSWISCDVLAAVDEISLQRSITRTKIAREDSSFREVPYKPSMRVGKIRSGGDRSFSEGDPEMFPGFQAWEVVPASTKLSSRSFLVYFLPFSFSSSPVVGGWQAAGHIYWTVKTSAEQFIRSRDATPAVRVWPDVAPYLAVTSTYDLACSNCLGVNLFGGWEEEGREISCCHPHADAEKVETISDPQVPHKMEFEQYYIGGPTARTFASHQGDLGLIPSGVTRILASGNRTRTMSLVDRFSRGSPISPRLFILGAAPYPLHGKRRLCHFKRSPVPNENRSFRWFSPIPRLLVSTFPTKIFPLARGRRFEMLILCRQQRGTLVQHRIIYLSVLLLSTGGSGGIWQWRVSSVALSSVRDSSHPAPSSRQSSGLRARGRPETAIAAARPPLPLFIVISTSAVACIRFSSKQNLAGRCRWSPGFLGDMPFPPPLHSGFASLTSLVLIGSEDLDVRVALQPHDGNTARLVRRNDEALGVCVRWGSILLCLCPCVLPNATPWIIKSGRAGPVTWNLPCAPGLKSLPDREKHCGILASLCDWPKQWNDAPSLLHVWPPLFQPCTHYQLWSWVCCVNSRHMFLTARLLVFRGGVFLPQNVMLSVVIVRGEECAQESDIGYQRTAQTPEELLARIMHAATEIKDSRVQLHIATRAVHKRASKFTQFVSFTPLPFAYCFPALRKFTNGRLPGWRYSRVSEAKKHGIAKGDRCTRSTPYRNLYAQVGGLLCSLPFASGFAGKRSLQQREVVYEKSFRFLAFNLRAAVSLARSSVMKYYRDAAINWKYSSSRSVISPPPPLLLHRLFHPGDLSPALSQGWLSRCKCGPAREMAGFGRKAKRAPD
ncbi:hypothetical protein PR048_008093 [Dryococelus australis]|uniref:Uncharacterized protein n=1 Tax=Dryococelus australis TaxID=614101 RepID=A0ABQ9HW47_9NEOP|nr:hypothetical protein PR048_008093 [Dryococelus australis]